MRSHRSELFVATAIAAVSFAFPAGAALAVAAQAPAASTAPGGPTGAKRPVELTLWRGEPLPCPASPGARAPSPRAGAVVSGGHGQCFRLSRAVMKVDRVRAATSAPQEDGSGWQVYLTFDDAQRREFAAVSAAAVGRQLAVLDNGVLIGAPTVSERIDAGVLQLTGLREPEAHRLARGLTHPGYGPPFSARPVAGDD